MHSLPARDPAFHEETVRDELFRERSYSVRTILGLYYIGRLMLKYVNTDPLYLCTDDVEEALLRVLKWFRVLCVWCSHRASTELVGVPPSPVKSPIVPYRYVRCFL